MKTRSIVKVKFIRSFHTFCVKIYAELFLSVKRKYIKFLNLKLFKILLDLKITSFQRRFNH